ncbi:hypothetical protein [Rhodovulum strictum]|uniref:Uncharacterized protein n=2 Tax=Rhodovulum strictum TaxID=58314 RepID=A0A844BPT8_9RHOB|nr:hypothetical protein [Rhodovulum strictum]MRH22953.1 hypothetical protein [Rhodovulum strictum]
MRLAQIEDDLVVNVIEAAPGAVPDWAAGWPEAGEAGPGWSYADGVFTPPPEPPPAVPETIRVIQFVRAMRLTRPDGSEIDPETGYAGPTAWDTHRATIEAHPDWGYITEIPRHDPLTLAVAAAMGATAGQMDAIWIRGAAL